MDSVQINSSTCETPPFPIVYLLCMSLWLCVLVIIQRHHIVKFNYKSFLFYLKPCFPPSPNTSKLFKLCKHGIYKILLEDSMITQRHRLSHRVCRFFPLKIENRWIFKLADFFLEVRRILFETRGHLFSIVKPSCILHCEAVLYSPLKLSWSIEIVDSLIVNEIHG